MKHILHVAIISLFVLTGCTVNINSTPSQTATSHTPSPIPFNLTDSNQITGWKMYTNTTHMYQVSFPADWQINAKEANNIEDYKDSNCCNTATLSISDSQSSWNFYINYMFTGGDFSFKPELCANSGSIQNTLCGSQTITNKSVLGYKLDKVRYFVKKTKDTYLVVFREPKHSLGFGEVGIDSEYVRKDQPKYHLEYQGSNIDKNMPILDKITSTLISLKE